MICVNFISTGHTVHNAWISQLRFCIILLNKVLQRANVIAILKNPSEPYDSPHGIQCWLWVLMGIYCTLEKSNCGLSEADCSRVSNPCALSSEWILGRWGLLSYTVFIFSMFVHWEEHFCMVALVIRCLWQSSSCRPIYQNGWMKIQRLIYIVTHLLAQIYHIPSFVAISWYTHCGSQTNRMSTPICLNKERPHLNHIGSNLVCSQKRVRKEFLSRDKLYW